MMNATTRALIAIPLAAAALTAGAGPVMADHPGHVFDGPPDDPGPDGPDDLDGPNPDNDDDDSDDDDDDSDDDDSDDDDSDDDDSDKKVRRPTRVDAGTDGASDGDLSVSWLLAGGAMVTAAGGFTARRAALKRS